MALLVRAAMAASLAALALGQRHAGMSGAFGRGFLPGAGNASSQPPAAATRPGFPPSLRDHNRGPRDSQAPPVVIVPFPVYGSPDAGPLTGPGAAQPAGEPPPPVMEPYAEDPYGPPQGIPRWAGPNPNENPPTCFSPPPEPPREPPGPPAEPIIYLIALKNQIIMEAFGYWIQDGALHYVSTAYGLNQVSLSLVDRDFSRRLNEERGVKFDLLSN